MRPAIQQWAGFYQLSLGGRRIIKKPGDKKCVIPGWPDINFRPEDFQAGQNIGVKSQQGIVIFDDDCAKRGLRLKRAFLPLTPAWYGRDSAKDAKALFYSPTLTTTHTWKDLNNDHLIQIRFGQQDMVPPSIHPCGERLRWAGPLWNGMLSPTPAEALITACNLRATAAVIALAWPAKGRREMLLAFSRVLLETLGLDDTTAEKVLLLACELGDFDHEGLAKATRAIPSTRAALDKHEHALGAGHIRKTLKDGAALLRRLREWFGKTNAVEEAVERLNVTYFLIDVGTETVVGEQVAQSEGQRRWTELQFRHFDDFKKKFIKDIVQTGTKKTTDEPVFKSVADVWLKHPAGTQYERLLYAPEGSGLRVGPRDLNGWKGFTVEPAPGHWPLTRDFLQQIICSGDERQFAWWMDWAAALVQKPGLHAETAPVLVGKQGVGKNFVAGNVLADSFDGRHAKITSSTRQVLGDFNDILSGVCLLVLDEVGLSSEREYSASKALVTGHTLHINRKNISLASERSMLHLMFLSNADVPLKVASDDRRFAFFHVADTYQNDTKYFASLQHELEHGGRAAMLHELLRRDVDWGRLRVAPDTKSKQTAKRAGWTSAQWFFYRMLRDVGATNWATTRKDAFRQLKKANETTAYLDYLKETNSRREVKDARAELHQELKKLVPRDFDFNRPVSEGGVLSRDYWTLPDFAMFCASFAGAVGCAVDELLADERGDVESVSDKAFADRDTEIPF